MLVLTTLKAKEAIQKQMEERFPAVQFKWKNSKEEANEFLEKADVIITYGEDLTNEDIDKAKNLKWIMVASAGLDKMPFDKIAEKGIAVTNARGIHAVPMAEYAIAMLLQVRRNAKQLYESEKKHIWDRTVKMDTISNDTMLICGTGAIGQETARLAKAFNMKTIGISRTGEKKPHFDECYTNDQLNKHIKDADYVVGILPSTPHTENYFGKEQFGLMNERAIFLNMGRGKTVDERALIEALEEKQFYHAVLDVFEKEPLDENSPLWDLENCTVTPHLSGIFRTYQEKAFEIFATNLEAFQNGSDLVMNVINPERGY
ncbi:D-2-hydroxyacid dehydrogenase [Bacillaceae bacterium W0354]